MGYLRKYYSKNTHLWSSRDAPQPGNDEKWTRESSPTSQQDSVQRGVEFYREHRRRVYKTFYQNCDEKFEKLKTWQIKNEPHKYFEVKYSIY